VLPNVPASLQRQPVRQGMRELDFDNYEDGEGKTEDKDEATSTIPPMTTPLTEIALIAALSGSMHGLKVRPSCSVHDPD